MSKLMGLLVAGVSVVVLAGGTIRAADEKVPLDKLPKAVVDALKAKYPDAKLVSAEKDDQDGKKVYEVEIKNGADSLEVTLSPEGKILGVEREIQAKDLPKAVKKAIAAKYPQSKIKKAEEISKDDKVTAYEVVIVTAEAKTLEVTFDPQGTFVDEEKVVEKKEKKK